MALAYTFLPPEELVTTTGLANTHCKQLHFSFLKICFHISPATVLLFLLGFFFLFFLHDMEHLHFLFQTIKKNLQAVLLRDKDPLVFSVS